ncbi:hypothetical protein CONLIGDRAFT_387598 [Coniochaeta ligniaria NRRL 30616]|uniref:Uncharacterized protein n=1 Tax=Coniochaeta ligniaria NRRL 30616 TaxID=1408157 RepID=A0A1J7IMI4_9PEZI|nr:hypothetical protein CONLIGDRAFT_387598 [Coniochaeta ligniaria NRRL 30616]
MFIVSIVAGIQYFLYSEHMVVIVQRILIYGVAMTRTPKGLQDISPSMVQLDSAMLHRHLQWNRCLRRSRTTSTASIAHGTKHMARKHMARSRLIEIAAVDSSSWSRRPLRERGIQSQHPDGAKVVRGRQGSRPFWSCWSRPATNRGQLPMQGPANPRPPGIPSQRPRSRPLRSTAHITSIPRNM